METGYSWVHYGTFKYGRLWIGLFTVIDLCNQQTAYFISVIIKRSTALFSYKICKSFLNFQKLINYDKVVYIRFGKVLYLYYACHLLVFFSAPHEWPHIKLHISLDPAINIISAYFPLFTSWGRSWSVHLSPRVTVIGSSWPIIG